MRLHALFYKNTENLAEPQIFLTSVCYFSNFPPLPPPKTALNWIAGWKLYFRTVKYIPRWIFLQIAKNIEPNLSLDILIKCILIKRKACIEFIIKHSPIPTKFLWVKFHFILWKLLFNTKMTICHILWIFNEDVNILEKQCHGWIPGHMFSHHPKFDICPTIFDVFIPPKVVSLYGMTVCHISLIFNEGDIDIPTTWLKWHYKTLIDTCMKF